jgi:hypothetical protein
MGVTRSPNELQGKRTWMALLRPSLLRKRSSWDRKLRMGDGGEDILDLELGALLD